MFQIYLNRLIYSSCYKIEIRLFLSQLKLYLLFDFLFFFIGPQLQMTWSPNADFKKNTWNENAYGCIFINIIDTWKPVNLFTMRTRYFSKVFQYILCHCKDCYKIKSVNTIAVFIILFDWTFFPCDNIRKKSFPEFDVVLVTFLKS